LNEGEFKAYQKNPEIAAQIRQDYEESIRLGIRGVPTVFINGKKMRDRSMKSLEAAINRQLEKAKAAKKGAEGTQ
jgi:protein-disulfide isomerase